MNAARRFCAVVILTLLLASCAVNPATGKRQLTLISESQEIQMGFEADKEMVASYGLYEDPALQQYVTSLGRKLAATSERPELDWQFRVVDDAAVNAFALPGGFVYITRGILAYFDNEVELASVLGHEIGHVTARHGVSQMSKAQLAQLGLGLGTILSPEGRDYSQLAETGLALLFLKYSRDDERQADDLGLRYIKRAKYDPRPMPGVYDMLGRVSAASGGGRAPAWMLTHPAPENREQRIAERIAASKVNYAGRYVGREEYLRAIEGIVFGDDPREGYFDETAFLHPTLKFRIDFPPGWSTRNEKASVSAVSPAEDAKVELTLAGAVDRAKALDEFMAQDGVQAGSPWLHRIGDLPVAGREFFVDLQQGRLRGLVAFVQYDDAVYRLLGFTPEAGWEENGRAMVRSISSFARLTDPAKLNVEPRRLTLVRPSRTMTLDEFARGRRATTDELALLNRLDPGATVTPDRTYKTAR